MPLSEHEQHLLSQMEQQLQADDPKFASTMRGSLLAGSGRRLVIGLVAVIGGLALIILAVAQNALFLAIPGFLIMLAGATYAFSAGRRRGPLGTVTSDGSTRPRRHNRSNEGLMNRLEQRWDQRREQGGL